MAQCTLEIWLYYSSRWLYLNSKLFYSNKMNIRLTFFKLKLTLLTVKRNLVNLVSHWIITEQCVWPRLDTIPCSSTSYCQEWIDITVCENGLCVCPLGYYHNDASDQCLPFGLGVGGCLTAEDCSAQVPNSYCNLDAVCACAMDYEQSGDVCLLVGKCLFIIENLF